MVDARTLGLAALPLVLLWCLVSAVHGNMADDDREARRLADIGQKDEAARDAGRRSAEYLLILHPTVARSQLIIWCGDESKLDPEPNPRLVRFVARQRLEIQACKQALAPES